MNADLPFSSKTCKGTLSILTSAGVSQPTAATKQFLQTLVKNLNIKYVGIT